MRLAVALMDDLCATVALARDRRIVTPGLVFLLPPTTPGDQHDE